MTPQRPVAVMLSPVLPRPGGSGRALRAWDWLQALSVDHEVHVWTPDAVSQAMEEPAGVRHWAGGADLLAAAPWPRRLGWLLPGLAPHWPRTAAHWLTPARRMPGLEAMARVIDPRRVARLVVFRLYLHGVAERLRRRLPVARAELDLDDWDSATLASVAAAQWRMGDRLQAVLTGRDALQYRALERHVPAAYDALWMAAADDLPAFPGARVWPNRLPPVLPVRVPPAVHGERLLFVGSLDYPPNQEAALFLALQLLPALRQRRALPWNLVIAGARPPAELRARLRGQAGVHLLADPPDLTPVYAASGVVLLPLWAGGGTKFKTLEALAHGRAAVATPESVRGLALQAGRHYLPASTVPTFAEAILHLQQAPARQALEVAGREWVEALASRAKAQPLTP